MSIPERPAQLLLLQDSLIKLKDYEVCFKNKLLFCDTVVLNLQKCILDGITYSFPILGSCMSPQVLLRSVSHGTCSLHSTCPVLTMICLRLYLVQEIRNSIDEPCYTV